MRSVNEREGLWYEFFPTPHMEVPKYFRRRWEQVRNDTYVKEYIGEFNTEQKIQRTGHSSTAQDI